MEEKITLMENDVIKQRRNKIDGKYWLRKGI